MEEPCERGGTNYFDRLPDELVTKIFRYILDELDDNKSPWDLRLTSTTRETIQWPSIAIVGLDKCHEHLSDRSCHKVVRNFREISADETLRNLCLTCKRFNRIINGRYFTTPESNQWPSLKIAAGTSTGEELHPCSACYLIKTSARSKFMKYKKLELHIYSPHPDQNCTLKAITDESSNLSTVVELNLHTISISAMSLNNILVALPSIKRLSVFISSFPHNYIIGEERPKTEGTVRVLSSLSLNLADSYAGHPLMEYISDHVTAREIWVQFEKSHEASQKWAREYLLRHKNTIRKYQFTFRGGQDNRSRIDRLAQSTFEGFDYHVHHGESGYSVSSSIGRYRSKEHSESVKYKRLALYSCAFSGSRILEAFEDHRACLSEVLELGLHQCSIYPSELSKILAVFPSIKRLYTCDDPGDPPKLKRTYHFCRESDSGDQLMPEEPACPISISHEPYWMDDPEEVHEYIMANLPANCVRIQFEEKNECECKLPFMPPWDRDTP